MPEKRLTPRAWRLLAAPVFLLGLWWLLTDGDSASWVVGIPAVAIAAWSLRQTGASTSGRISFVGLLQFLPLFAWETLRGGADVALRVLSPRMSISPGFSNFRTRLERKDARLFLTNCVSLVPGTLAANLRGNELVIHEIDQTSDTEAEIKRLEQAVSRVFPETGNADTNLT